MLGPMTVPLPSLTDTLVPIGAALDALSHAERVNWMRGLSRRELKALYVLADGGSPLPLAYYHGAEGEIVRHHGQNSLPAFSSFEKRFVLREGGVQGYNHNSRLVSMVSGPGHFVARQDGDAEVLFDYTTLPASRPDAFPELKSNDKGTAKLVFGGMVDRVRRVSTHSTIGTAFRNGKPENAWFMLVREGDPS
ncbi:MAG: hypothetical protein ACI8S6_004329 [Myxococcota bacterium]|jgi:hypothetical protein